MESERYKRQVTRLVPFFVSLVVHITCLVWMSVFWLENTHKHKPVSVSLSFDDRPNDLSFETVLDLTTSDNSENESSDKSYLDVDSLIMPTDPIEISYLIEPDTIQYADYMPSIKDLVSFSDTSSKNQTRAMSKQNKPGSGYGFGDSLKGSIKERLSLYGAGTGDVQISIAWDNYNDIDVWVVLKDYSSSGTICWMNRSLAGGFLDIDKNVTPETNKAIENIFWPTGSAPYCQYTVYIQHYHTWDKTVPTKVFIRILVDGDETYRYVTIRPIDGMKKIHTFTRKPPKRHINAAAVGVAPALPITKPNVEFTPYDNLILPAPTFQ